MRRGPQLDPGAGDRAVVAIESAPFQARGPCGLLRRLVVGCHGVGAEEQSDGEPKWGWGPSHAPIVPLGRPARLRGGGQRAS